MHVLEAPSPLKQSMSVMFLFPSPDISDVPFAPVPFSLPKDGRPGTVLHSTVPPAKQAGEASRRGKDAFLDQFPPEPNTMIEIDLQDADGGTTLRR
jgi:hypothetical protein